MRLYIPDMTEFFAFCDLEGFRYAVLRDFEGYAHGFPKAGGKQDVDLLVEDALLPLMRERYGRISKRRGVKCDVYSVSGADDGGYFGYPYYPPSFARDILDKRVWWKDLFYVPTPEHHLLALMYHLAYQKAENSGLHMDNPEAARGTKYYDELESLTKTLGIAMPYTLMEFHTRLKAAGLVVPYDVLAAYLKNEFARHRKSMFLGRLCDEMKKGELNLFVIRKTAVKKKQQDAMMEAIRAAGYDVLAVKDIPWRQHVTKSRKMRGGKWRRGGRPMIAVVVFDRAPVLSNAEDRKTHPHVFNKRQYFKQVLRVKFTGETGADPKSNPIHSTDNEAEAIGHFPMFFTDAEQRDIFAKAEKIREAL